MLQLKNYTNGMKAPKPRMPEEIAIIPLPNTNPNFINVRLNWNLPVGKSPFYKSSSRIRRK
jgi:hypothetical protein